MKVFKDSHNAIWYMSNKHDNWNHQDDFTEIIIWPIIIQDEGSYWEVNELHKNWGEDITLGMFPDIKEAIRYTHAYEMHDYNWTDHPIYYDEVILPTYRDW